MKLYWSLFIGLTLLGGPVNSLRSAEAAQARPSNHEIMAAMSINPGLWEAAMRVLGASAQFSQNPSQIAAQQLTANLNLLASACGNYRRNVRDAGWQEIRSDFASLVSQVRQSVNATAKSTAVNVDHLSNSLRRCENIAQAPTYR